MYLDRLSRLQAGLTEASLSAIGLLPGPSLRYLSAIDFHLYERPILGIFRADADPVMVVPAMELAKAKTSPLTFDYHSYAEDPAGQINAFSSALRATNLGEAALAVEPLSMRFHELHLLQTANPGLEIVDGSAVLAQLRSRKDEAELDRLRKAVAIAQEAMDAVLPTIKIGMTEREVAAALVVALYEAGSDLELPFQPIVAGGPNSARPHASVTDRPLTEGGFLLIDWGARFEGYCSDLTRTFALGEPNEEMRAVYAAVRAANQAAREAVATSVTTGAIDKAGREEIIAAGFGEGFTHRIGHGLGLEAHEEPYLFPGSEVPLAEGNTFTIEPGVYREGWGGVRIEDDVVVTAAGGQNLSTMSRDLKVIG